MKYVVIGARGFIGAWICRQLAEEGIAVTALDSSASEERTRTVLNPAHLEFVRFRQVDALDEAALRAAFDEDVTHVIHLVGLLRPASEIRAADSIRLSVGALLNALSCARRTTGRHLPLVYSSAGAVYGSLDNHPGGRVTAASVPRPKDHYGVQRLTMELSAEVFWRDHGVSSVGLRPWIVYGPGRENGYTASPSLAMLAAAAGAPYRIAFGGRGVYHHVADVARAFILASRAVPARPVVANIPGETLHMSELVGHIVRGFPDGRSSLEFEDRQNDSVWIVDDPTLTELTGCRDWGRAEVRIPETVRDYQALLAAGLVSRELLGSAVKA